MHICANSSVIMEAMIMLSQVRFTSLAAFFDPCLSWGFTAVNRLHDQGKSYKKHLVGAGLQVQGFSLLSSRWEHGSIQAGMVQAQTESCTSCSKGSYEKIDFQVARMRVSKPIPTVTHLLPTRSYPVSYTHLTLPTTTRV